MFEVDLKAHKPCHKVENSFLCNVRKRLISATPEEEVRQALINYLVSEKGYPIQNISIEIPLTYFPNGKGKKGRADIVIFDDDKNVLCLIECKEPNECLSDSVLDQILRYDEVINSENLCIAIGNKFHFLMKEKNELLLLTEFPSFKTLMENGQVGYFINEKLPFERYIYKNPIPQVELDYLIDDAVIGIDTDSKYFPFLINLYNFFLDESDKVENLEFVEDIGLKITKYGNASGGRFFGSYRAFLDLQSKSVVSFSISSMTRGDGFPIHTSLMLGVDIRGDFHLSLELRIDKHVLLNNNYAEITHDGTITIGKLGAAKRSELLEFIQTSKPHLIKNGKIFLGKINYKRDIRSNFDDTREFLLNCIEYALVRDEFREFKKKATANSNQDEIALSRRAERENFIV